MRFRGRNRRQAGRVLEGRGEAFCVACFAGEHCRPGPLGPGRPRPGRPMPRSSSRRPSVWCAPATRCWRRRSQARPLSSIGVRLEGGGGHVGSPSGEWGSHCEVSGAATVQPSGQGARHRCGFSSGKAWLKWAGQAPRAQLLPRVQDDQPPRRSSLKLPQRNDLREAA